VVGAGLHPDAAREAASQDGASRVIIAPPDVDFPVLARGDFQRRNFALARAAAEAYLGSVDEEPVRAAAAATVVPGRFQELDGEPPTVLDGAHNPGGIAALAGSLPAYLGGRPLTVVLSILEDKDAAEMLRELLPHAAHLVLTTNANPRALPAPTLESLAHQLGATDTLVEPDPRRALALARARAADERGVVLATGSIYLIADLMRRGENPGSTL
jgi:dihydrofolate synthase/folylpolyglutamate synthase